MPSVIVSSPEDDRAERNEPIVPWWSFTKTAIAAAALSLVAQNKIALDDALTAKPYTWRQLLQHRAGLGDYGSLPDYRAAVVSNAEPWPVAEMHARTNASTLLYPPGEGWLYSNIGYAEVRRLIEDVAGAPLRVVLRDRVLRPLGLTQARLAESASDLAGVDMNGVRYDPRWVYHGLLVGPLHEARQLLDGVIAGELLPQRERDAMMSPFSLGEPIAGRPFKAPAYGLGLMIDNDAPIMRYGHTGGGPGSVIAVYRTQSADGHFTRAAFAHGDDPAIVESAAFAREPDDAAHHPAAP